MLQCQARLGMSAIYNCTGPPPGVILIPSVVSVRSLARIEDIMELLDLVIARHSNNRPLVASVVQYYQLVHVQAALALELAAHERRKKRQKKRRKFWDMQKI